MSTELTTNEQRNGPLHPVEFWPRAYGRLAVALLAIGVIARLFRWYLCFPLWGDEASVALNIRDRTYAGLLQQLDHFQVAPVLFLWGERTVGGVFGFSEYALRLIPLFAGLGSLFLLGYLARHTLPPLAGVVAIGLLAVSRWPVSLSSQVKPYSLDLLFALAVLVPAVRWLRRPDQNRWLVLLVAVVPVAVGSSFPVVFVAGGVSLALLPEVWRRAKRGTWAWFVAYNGLLVASFVLFDVVLARQQLGDAGDQMHDFMTDYWKRGFPPFDPLGLLRWLVVVHTGLLMAYPLGNTNGAGLLAFPLVVLGAVAAWRRGWQPFVVLCLAPFALNIVAAALHRYPYGGCCRLSQHLAPAIVLLFGVGVEAVVTRARQAATARLRAARVATVLFGLLAVAGAVTYALKPYREEIDLWSRDLARDLTSRTQPGDRVVIVNPPSQVPAVALYYLTTAGATTSPGGQDRPAPGGRVWYVTFLYGIPTGEPVVPHIPLPHESVPADLTWSHDYVLVDNRGQPTWRAVVWCRGVPAGADSARPPQSPAGQRAGDPGAAPDPGR